EHPLWFIKDSTIEPFELNLHGFIVIGDTGVHGFTSQAINIVREKLVEEKEKTQDSINHLGQLATDSKDFLMTDKLK
ncbi:hypothetical protein WL670_14760, partial [Staphylococcus pasteuri]